MSTTLERRSAPAVPWTVDARAGVSLDAVAAWLTGAVRRAWLQTLVAGLAIWFVVSRVAISTQNTNLIPSVIAVGAFLGPVVFVIYVYERAREVSWPDLLRCFIGGGLLGITAAGLLEYQTLRGLGALPTIAIGLIEETSKLIVPLAIFALARYRREADGLLFGVASGMGFAAFESMGYGFSTLLASGGHIGAVEQVLFLRGILSPAGHGAWTGLICAALWRARVRDDRFGILLVVAAFATAVTLHALWDAANSMAAQLPVALVSLGLIAWRIHVAGRPQRAPVAAAT